MKRDSIGVGRFRVTWKSAVTVHGGVAAPAFCIRWWVAAQLLWQSSRAPQMPPFKTPSKASWCGSGCQSATTSSP